MSSKHFWVAFDGSICNDFGGWKEVVECSALIFFSISLSPPLSLSSLFFFNKWITVHLFVMIHRELLVACNDQEKKIGVIKVVGYIRLENFAGICSLME